MPDSKLPVPKVSIIVPIYGVEKYLNECVDSILNQTLRDIEVILVDDGSKDRCPQMIDEYASKDSRVVAVHQPNGGYGRAVNHGIEVATGEYIGIVESDDWIEPTMYEELYDKAQETESDVVKSDFFHFWSDPKKNEQAHMFPEKIIGLTICPRKFGDKNIFSLAPSIWSCLYKKEFLLENNIKFNETPGASYQDVSFNFKVYACAERFHFMNKAFVHYRQDNENSSVKSTGKIYAIFDEYDSSRNFLKEKGMWTQPLISYFLHVQGFHWMWHYKRLSSSHKAVSLFIARIQEELIRLANEIPNFDRIFRDIHPSPFLLFLKEYPNLARLLFVYFKKQVRVVSKQNYARVKFCGFRIFKISY
jgi:glycosyltransferase involved in cell wall biosynthesis